jgi:hypothetical protein
MNTLEILKAARAIITNEKNFTQGEFARDSLDNKVLITDTRACKFCSVGAIRKVPGTTLNNQQAAIRHLENTVGGSIEDFNDSYSHSVVLWAWDKLIAKFEATK